jgi:hypothetical protein
MGIPSRLSGSGGLLLQSSWCFERGDGLASHSHSEQQCNIRAARGLESISRISSFRFPACRREPLESQFPPSALQSDFESRWSQNRLSCRPGLHRTFTSHAFSGSVSVIRFFIAGMFHSEHRTYKDFARFSAAKAIEKIECDKLLTGPDRNPRPAERGATLSKSDSGCLAPSGDVAR